jgi:hypothetical protein
MSDKKGNMSDKNILTEVLSALEKADKDGQKRILKSAVVFLDISLDDGCFRSTQSEALSSSDVQRGVSFSEDRSMSAKDFMHDKSPKTDIERIACLAYYLTHYKDMPHFKTLDLSVLNMEAAQPKFSNAAVAADNASKKGYLVQATKGNKQLSSHGEEFVRLLPDRDAAKIGIATMRPKKKSKKKLPKKGN